MVKHILVNESIDSRTFFLLNVWCVRSYVLHMCGIFSLNKGVNGLRHTSNLYVQPVCAWIREWDRSWTAEAVAPWPVPICRLLQQLLVVWLSKFALVPKFDIPPVSLRGICCKDARKCHFDYYHFSDQNCKNKLATHRGIKRTSFVRACSMSSAAIS